MFCSHNTEDLEPVVVCDIEHDIDWVAVVCKACGEHLGQREQLIKLLDTAIQTRRAQREELEGI